MSIDNTSVGENRGGLGTLEWSGDSGSSWNDIGKVNRNDFQGPTEETEESEDADGKIRTSWMRAPFSVLARQPNAQNVNNLQDKMDQDELVHYRWKSLDENVIVYMPPTDKEGIYPFVEKGPIQEPGTYAFARIRGEASGPRSDYIQEIKIYSV